LVGSTRHVVLADTDAEAVSLARRAYRAYAEHFHATEVRIAGGVPKNAALPQPGGVNFDAMIEAGQVLAGSPSTVRDSLRRFMAAVGPQHNYLCGAFQWGDLTTEEAGHSLDLFAAEVKPALT
jgi:alkanesulfonate monooxygenase SsuD/methylene tetrahydromethanopterin reductase-like flavin-dependent oxidoreductase (luciferase family)